METSKSSCQGVKKRPMESSSEVEKSVPSSKKSKPTFDESEDHKKGDDTGACLNQLNNKESLPKSPFNEPRPKKLKRSIDIAAEEATCLSPSKKRKSTQSQKDTGQALSSQYGNTEKMDRKMKRMKKKALLKAVLDQMEFYFSDCNLSKDRFLRKMYDSSDEGYIDLSVFSNFNKLQSLDKDGIHGDILCKALAKSKLLEVSEDKTKVRRRAPLKELKPEEVDRRTIYVEHLPEYASHSWIKKIFSQCGKVCYVSLPKYQTTKEIKGFAFVEFASAEEAEKACQTLNNPLPAKTEDKPGKFPKWNKTLKGLHKVAPPIKPDELELKEDSAASDCKEDQTPTPTKRKKKNLKKKRDDSLDAGVPTPDQTEALDDDRKRKNVKRKDDEVSDKLSSSELSEVPEERKKKKKKKRKLSVGAEEGNSLDKDSMDGPKVESGLRIDESLDLSNSETEKSMQTCEKEKENSFEEKKDVSNVKKKKKKRKKKRPEEILPVLDHDGTVVVPRKGSVKMSGKSESKNSTNIADTSADCEDGVCSKSSTSTSIEGSNEGEVKLSRKERKLLRQEDIRRKKAERERKMTEESVEADHSAWVEALQRETVSKEDKRGGSGRERLDSFRSESSEIDSPSKIYIKRDGSQVTSILGKSRKQDIVKRVEFDPVPITTEFVERKEIRRRKKQKRDSLHLRVLSKKEWLGLRAEYIQQQKSHMSALKESLRELRMQELGNQMPTAEDNGTKHVDLTNVFGTKRMKLSNDVKVAHVEALQFIPNVIVQWKSSHDIKRNKIKTMFSEIASDSIAYIEGKEEAKSGYIRFKDEASAEEFARLSRNSDSFSARVLPESKQASYWEKANNDRIAKLSRKKNERGSDKIARKVFDRNKVTFQAKGSRIVFGDDEDHDKADDNADANKDDNKEKISEDKVDKSGQDDGNSVTEKENKMTAS